ncbi:MAG: hypothetical protein NZZ41_07685, partial [Candidatus Dojkabacteria bacterium]|nr:hypothetical protein [Candidatus Dojkabacteria bacterium]
HDALVQKSRIDVIEKLLEIYEIKDEIYYKALKSTHEKLLNDLRATPFKTYEENTNIQLNIRDSSDIYELINRFSENAFFFIEERYNADVFSRLSNRAHLNVFDSILSMPIYCISVKQLVDESEDGDVMLYTTWLPGIAAYYVLNHVGERYILKDDYIVRVNIDPQEFYDWAQVQIMESPKKYGRKSFIEMFSIYIKERYNIQSFAEYIEQTIEEIKRDINPYKYAITAHLIKDYEEEEDPAEKLYKGETIFRIIANALAPLDEQTYDFITHPVDFESFKGNSIDSESAILGQRMAESMFQRRIKELKSEGTYEKRYANESEFLMNLINPVLFYVLNSQEILYNYLSSADISANNYVLASLEPTTKYFDPLPRRFVYNINKDKEAIRFFRRRKLIKKDFTELNDFYNTEIAVFTDILPLRSLTVEYEGIETDQVGSFFKIDIPTRWNMYQPTIRMEVYDNAHRDLYNYFLRYKKIAFYKSVARPAFDISFILDIISLNADLALQNIVSYIVVPKNIDMKYLEYNEQFSSEPYVISFDFSVIGFIYYTNSGIGTLNTGGLQGTYHHLPGAFIEIDEYPSSIKSKDFIENSYDAMIYYARNAVLNWYGIQNLNPVSVLTNDEKYTGRANAASLIPIINESGNPTEYEKRYWGSFHNLITNEL